MSQSAPSDLFARPKARRSEDGGQEECHGRAGLGRSPGVAGAVWDGSGLPWVIFQPVRHEGCQHLGPARLMWPEPRHLWAFPPGLRHRECLGTFPTCPKTLRSLLQGCHGRAGTLAGPGPAVARRPVQGAGSSWGCGKVGLWTIIDASSLASVVILHTYPHLFSPLLSHHRCCLSLFQWVAVRAFPGLGLALGISLTHSQDFELYRDSTLNIHL